MQNVEDEDLTGSTFRECDLSGSTFVGVMMRDATIDGLVTNLVVNGVEVMGYVEAELDRRHPVRVLLRSTEVDNLREAARQLREDWASTLQRLRRDPGSESRTINGEWSALQTLRHLVFVHDSWFGRCCLGSSEPFSPLGLGQSALAGLEPADAEISLDDVANRRSAQQDELEAWLDDATPASLSMPAPIPDDGRWPPYANGRTVRECLAVVLDETFLHHGFCVRDLDLIDAERG